ncbi:MAG TPA: hypothetical protein VD905_22105, partial [Flavobacteriales bacterium]|nr:hypothetical protein [Flavobacteriales bacterium]
MGNVSVHLTGNGSINVITGTGKYRQAAPLAYDTYKKKPINIAYAVQGTMVTYNLTNHVGNSFVIDPWMGLPDFPGGVDRAFDIDVDNAGHAYVYGGSVNNYSLLKYNDVGALEWSFTPPVSFLQYYGDFVVDPASGSVYIVCGLLTDSFTPSIIKLTSTVAWPQLFSFFIR